MLTFLYILVLTGVCACFVIAKSNFQIHGRRSEQDLPLQQDLDTFLTPVETLTNYLAKNITDIEINFALGIFFTNVHLGRVLLDKGQNLPKELKSRVKAIVDTNEESLFYFHEKARKDDGFMSRDHVIISYLFVNSTYWINSLKSLKYEAQPKYSRNDLENIYSEWKIYKDNIDNVYRWNPSPRNSDVCLVTLSINPNNKENFTSWCPIAKQCYTMLSEGTDFGYALNHRLGLLIMAHLGRRCYLLSVQEDDELMQKFCTMAYAEAEYIAMNDYEVIDLVLEIMCLCSMGGRLQFLRRTWLYKMFDFQNANGCFGVANTNIEYRRTELAGCNSHTTSLASGTYAAAVRFILERYY